MRYSSILFALVAAVAACSSPDSTTTSVPEPENVASVAQPLVTENSGVLDSNIGLYTGQIKSFESAYGPEPEAGSGWTQSNPGICGLTLIRGSFNHDVDSVRIEVNEFTHKYRLVVQPSIYGRPAGAMQCAPLSYFSNTTHAFGGFLPGIVTTQQGVPLAVESTAQPSTALNIWAGVSGYIGSTSQVQQDLATGINHRFMSKLYQINATGVFPYDTNINRRVAQNEATCKTDYYQSCRTVSYGFSHRRVGPTGATKPWTRAVTDVLASTGATGATVRSYLVNSQANHFCFLSGVERAWDADQGAMLAMSTTVSGGSDLLIYGPWAMASATCIPYAQAP